MINIKKYNSKDVANQSHLSDYSAIKNVVEDIHKQVKQHRDRAVIDYTLKFDVDSDATLFSLLVSKKEYELAYSKVSKEFIQSIQVAKKNITAFHEEQVPKNWEKEAEGGYTYGMQYSALDIVGLYVPGGLAMYPSSVLMNAIPAKIAGVNTLVMTSPPQKNGELAPEILVAAQECGVDVVIKAGGAQAIFGLAYGTESIPKVDKIVGPGNAYVDQAKQMVYGVVDIDKPAGPSEVLVYVESCDYASYAAAEVLAQCEHDPLASGVVISSDRLVLNAVNVEIERQLGHLIRKDIIKESLKNSCFYLVKNEQEAIEAMNNLASEHLCLCVDNFASIRPYIKHAGAIFCGPFTPVALGDYVAGPNHVLPTAKAARFSSALGVMDFMKFSSHLTCSKKSLADLAPHVQVLTNIERLDAHYKSVEQRFNS